MEYNVKRLPHGYLVSDKDYEPVAGFSNFEDLAFWLNDKFRIEPYSATEPAWDKAPDGWIDWKGGEPPAIADPVMVRFRDGEEHETNVRNMRWNHTGSIADIVAYRAVTQSVSINDGWIEWKGGEPPAIAKGTPIIVRQRHGVERTTTMGDAFTFNAFWRNDNCEEDIVSYKVCD